MKKATQKTAAISEDPLKPRNEDTQKVAVASEHVYNKDVVCITDSRGYATHRNLSPLEIRVDASDGFIPLWAEDVTLRYRFRERGIRQHFADATAAKSKMRMLFGEALVAWGDAAPVRFIQDDNASDFEFVMMTSDDCDSSGCVLASAFFPDAGRHEFRMYPKMFTQSREEQVETFIHEIGHIFGLRHFFANIREAWAPSRLFGEDNPFSIMNYGTKSVLTDADKRDLKQLYKSVWSGQLTEIDGAPIRLVKPFSSLIGSPRVHSLAASGLESTLLAAAREPVQLTIGGRRITIE